MWIPSMAGASKVRCYGYPVWQEGTQRYVAMDTQYGRRVPSMAGASRIVLDAHCISSMKITSL